MGHITQNIEFRFHHGPQNYTGARQLKVVVPRYRTYKVDALPNFWDFATGIASPVDLKVSADGFLYYLARGAGSVGRIGFTQSGDNVAPTVSITSPANGAIIARKSNVTITANASDNVGVTRVEFLVNGALQCTDTTAPYSCVWHVPAAMNKTYQLQARGFDLAGNVGTSTVQVTAR